MQEARPLLRDDDVCATFHADAATNNTAGARAAHIDCTGVQAAATTAHRANWQLSDATDRKFHSLAPTGQRKLDVTSAARDHDRPEHISCPVSLCGWAGRGGAGRGG